MLVTRAGALRTIDGRWCSRLDLDHDITDCSGASWRAPFRLVRIEIPETREGLAHLALIRREELDGFVERLFGNEQSLELPEGAHRALDALSELRAIFDGLYELACNPTKPVTADDIAQTRRNIRELTR
jgi:hypothetical protein